MQPYSLESTWNIVAILLAFAVIQATFQISVSVLTLLSGHSLGKKRSSCRLLGLDLAYIVGNFSMLMLVFGAILYAVFTAVNDISSHDWWLLVVAPVVVALVILSRYYRKGRGTALWLPRSAAAYLTDRAKRTHNVFESLMLGAASALLELPFTIVPMTASAYLMILFVRPIDHLMVASIYCFIVVTPLILTTILIAGGHRLSIIQRWREDNKAFLQYAAAAMLLATALFIHVFVSKGPAL
jgi:hypothetical protein